MSWHNESARHAKAAKGQKTGRKEKRTLNFQSRTQINPFDSNNRYMRGEPSRFYTEKVEEVPIEDFLNKVWDFTSLGDPIKAKAQRKRWEKDPDHKRLTAKYLKAMKRGDKFPPALAEMNEGNDRDLIAIDGRHRAMAAKQLGRKTILVQTLIWNKGYEQPTRKTFDVFNKNPGGEF